MLRRSQVLNVSKCKSSSHYTLVRFLWTTFRERGPQLRKQRPYFGSPKTCMMMGLAWCCGWHDGVNANHVHRPSLESFLINFPLIKEEVQRRPCGVTCTYAHYHIVRADVCAHVHAHVGARTNHSSAQKCASARLQTCIIHAFCVERTAGVFLGAHSKPKKPHWWFRWEHENLWDVYQLVLDNISLLAAG